MHKPNQTKYHFPDESPISALNIDTGFLGFFSGLIMALTNMNIKVFCATTESDEPRILKGGFWLQTCKLTLLSPRNYLTMRMAISNLTNFMILMRWVSG